MECKGIAKLFVEYFCKADLEGISTLLSSDFRLKGPLFEFDSKDAYIESLIGNLDEDENAKILSVLGEGSEAAVFYTYRENLIGQLFWCREGKITETLLVFDTGNAV